MQKVQVIERFICRLTQRHYQVGEVLHVSDERAAELKDKGKVQYKADPAVIIEKQHIETITMDEKMHTSPIKKKKINKK